MKHGTPDTIKFQRLQRRLGLTKRETVGILELLWHATTKSTPQADIGRFSNEDIAIACDFDGEPDDLIRELIETGWLDESEEHRLIVHDWSDHAPNFVRGNLASRSLEIFGAKRTAKRTAKHPAASVPLPNPTQPSPTKPNPTATTIEGPWLLLYEWLSEIGVRYPDRCVESARARGEEPDEVLSRCKAACAGGAKADSIAPHLIHGKALPKRRLPKAEFKTEMTEEDFRWRLKKQGIHGKEADIAWTTEQESRQSKSANGDQDRRAA